MGPGRSLALNCANTSLVGSMWPMRRPSLNWLQILESYRFWLNQNRALVCCS